jgi:predicted dehydrogenase
MQQNPLKVALIGCGRIGALTRPELRNSLPPGWLPLNHAEAIAATPGLLFDSACDLDSGPLERLRDAFGVRTYTDFRRQISETRPDIVSIATRTATRGEIVNTAMRGGVRGLHCEKPIATSLNDCRRILGDIASAGAKLTYGTTRRFMDIFRQARAMLDDGEIGGLLDVEIQFGRALLMWTHPHSADLLLNFTGGAAVSSVRGRCTMRVKTADELVVDDDPTVDSATILFDSGITGRLTPATGMHVILTGAQGVMTVGEDGRWLEIAKSGREPRRIPIAPTMSGTARAFCELEAAVRHDGPTPVKPSEIESGMAILLAIAESARRDGAPVSPDSIDGRFTVTGRYGEKYA